MADNIRVSEKFFTISGESPRTGTLTYFVRLHGCNLRCPGFFQPDPTNESTYLPGYKEIDISTIKKLDDLPVVKTGCDSFYSWDPKFRHLGTLYSSIDDLVSDIKKDLPNGEWFNERTKNQIDLSITGGEPMLQQHNVVKIIDRCGIDVIHKDRALPIVQIETNGTIPLTKEFIDYHENILQSMICFNVSPKLYHVSGEKDQVNYDVISSYFNLSGYGCLKFVINNDDRAWDELNRHVEILMKRYEMRFIPVYIMPVGATYEQQADSEYLTQIANRAIKEGYHISGRLHCNIWGNTVGV